MTPQKRMTYADWLERRKTEMQEAALKAKSVVDIAAGGDAEEEADCPPFGETSDELARDIGDQVQACAGEPEEAVVEPDPSRLPGG